MLSKTLTASLALAATVAASTYKKVDIPEDPPEDWIDPFEEWTFVMKMNYPGYLYEFYEVTADDGYITTLIHIYSNDGSVTPEYKDWTPKRETPVLIMNGANSKVTSWFMIPRKSSYADKTVAMEGGWVMDLADGRYKAKLDWLKKKDPALYEKYVTGEAKEAHEAMEAIGAAEAKCTMHRLDEEYDVYLTNFDVVYSEEEPEEGEDPAIVSKTLKTDDEGFTSKPSLPMAMFDYGFDVWVSGNRGTIYNQKHVDDPEDSTVWASDPDTYWAGWDFTEIGTQDVFSQIDAINAITGKNVNYVGYSQGTTAMMQALAIGENTETIAKIDRVSLLTPCPYIKPFAPAGTEDVRQWAIDEITAWQDSSIDNFMMGSSYVAPEWQYEEDGVTIKTDEDGNQLKNPGETVSEYRKVTCDRGNVAMCTFMPFAPFSGEQSLNSYYKSIISSIEKKTYRDYDIEGWKTEGKTGTVLDYSKISGPEIYVHFAGDEEVCDGKAEVQKIPTLKTEYEYECASHMDPGLQDTKTQQDFIKNVVISLNATSLAMGAAIATSALALF